MAHKTALTLVLSSMALSLVTSLTTCPGFPGFCSESFPGHSCNVVCDFGRNNVPLCQASLSRHNITLIACGSTIHLLICASSDSRWSLINQLLILKALCKHTDTGSFQEWTELYSIYFYSCPTFAFIKAIVHMFGPPKRITISVTNANFKSDHHNTFNEWGVPTKNTHIRWLILLIVLAYKYKVCKSLANVWGCAKWIPCHLV